MIIININENNTLNSISSIDLDGPQMIALTQVETESVSELSLMLEAA